MEKDKIEEGDQNDDPEVFTGKLFDGKVLGECLKKAVHEEFLRRKQEEERKKENK